MIQYMYKGKPVRIIQLVMDDLKSAGDEQDFCECAIIALDDGTQKSVNSCAITPDPSFVLMGLDSTNG